MLKKLVRICVIFFFFSCAGGPSSGRGEPEWVRDPYTRYNKQSHVAAVGGGNSRELAEKNALGNLVAIFGQSIQIDEKVSLSYEEAAKNGAIARFSENTSVDTIIVSQTGMNSLVGAEIGDVWFDGKGEYWAVAVLDKAKALQVYSGIVKSNLAIIENLTRLDEAEKYTLDGFARYRFAATVADLTASYANLLAVIGMPVQGLKRGEDFRLEAVNIARAIPVSLRVRDDRAGRIEGAFARALSDLGFRSGGNNSRYLLDVNISALPVEITSNPNKFTRIEITANLVDTDTLTVLLPYGFSSRQGHITQPEADNRAYAAAERIIDEEYSSLFSDFFSRLLSGKQVN